MKYCSKSVVLLNCQHGNAKFHVSHVQTSYAYSARPNHAKFQDQQSKGVDATKPQSWSKSQKTRFLVIFAIFDGLEF